MIETIRTYDGSNNNLNHPHWGRAGEALTRDPVGHAYAEGSNDPVRADGPNPRVISNRVCRQNDPEPNASGLTDFVWAWGQFLDHELDFTPDVGEPLCCRAPADDPVLPSAWIKIKRSKAKWGYPWEQINELSSYIDGANVYGPSKERADALRTRSGGMLRTEGDRLLPKNIHCLDNVMSRDERFFLAGDKRANEHVVLTSMHTLFVREHNRYCDLVSRALGNANILPANPDDCDEEIFQRARRYVGALMQVITYQQFLPALLGDSISEIGNWNGYEANTNATISNLFSTVCYRLGHSMLSESIILNDGNRLLLRDAFFRPELLEEQGIDQFLGGLHRQKMSRIDTRIVESVRSFLFRTPGGRANRIGDLGAFNILRGRDHGLPDYNVCRKHFGLSSKDSFEEITTDSDLAPSLELLYGDVNSVDPWIGGLAEDHEEGGNMGEFIRTILVDQFKRLRDGDRFWYQHDKNLKKELTDIPQPERMKLLGEGQVADVIDHLEGVTLTHILRKNTTIGELSDEGLPDNLFVCKPA